MTKIELTERGLVRVMAIMDIKTKQRARIGAALAKTTMERYIGAAIDDYMNIKGIPQIEGHHDRP